MRTSLRNQSETCGRLRGCVASHWVKIILCLFALFTDSFFHISLENKNQPLSFFLAERTPCFVSRSSLTSPFLTLLQSSLNVRQTCPESVASSCSPRLDWFTATPLGPKLWQLPRMLCKSSRTFWDLQKATHPKFLM